MEQRVQWVDDNREEHGLNRCLSACGLPRSSYFDRRNAAPQAERDAPVIAAIRRIIADNPSYGWRRLQAELFEVDGLVVNHKRLKRILSVYELGLPRNVAQRRHNGPAGLLNLHTGKLDLVRGRTFGPLEAFSTDFTELHYAGGRKAWMMVIVDIHSKLAAGWRVGPSRNTGLALDSLTDLASALRRLGLALPGRFIHHDKDSVYTGYAWLAEALLRHGMHVSFSENGARHNPWVESLWSRTKHEAESLITEASDLAELAAVIDTHFVYYNTRRRHTGLGNVSPMAYLRNTGFHPLSDN